MYASTVLNVSSFWPAGPHLNETLCPVTMPANTSAEILGCGYPQYHPFQITGSPSTNAYGDNSRAFCPATKTGTGGFTTGGDQYLRFAFDPSASYERDGYTEFIVVGFPRPCMYRPSRSARFAVPGRSCGSRRCDAKRGST